MYVCECVCTCEVCARIPICKGIHVFVCVCVCMCVCVCVCVCVCLFIGNVVSLVQRMI